MQGDREHGLAVGMKDCVGKLVRAPEPKPAPERWRQPALAALTAREA